MDKNSSNLVDIFHKVANKGWIEGVGNSWGNIGLTFENEIGKKPDSKYNPDYKDIEIKCTTRYSRYPLYLFTIAFDSSENEVIRLAEEYGYSDPDFPNKKVIFKKVTNSIVDGNKYNFFFDVNRQDKKIYLCVYSDSGRLLEKKAYITFDSLKKHLETKLDKVAFIKASMKTIEDKKFYRYYSMFLYKIKEFENFLELIERNILTITIISRISKSGIDRGRYRNKNVVFAIDKDKLDKMFDCYYKYNRDYSL